MVHILDIMILMLSLVSVRGCYLISKFGEGGAKKPTNKFLTNTFEGGIRVVHNVLVLK